MESFAFEVDVLVIVFVPTSSPVALSITTSFTISSSLESATLDANEILIDVLLGETSGAETFESSGSLSVVKYALAALFFDSSSSKRKPFARTFT